MSARTEAAAFHRRARAKVEDLDHRQKLAKATATYHAAVAAGRTQFVDWEAARSRAQAIKHEAVNHLHRYLLEFERAAAQRGTRVFWAGTAAEARDYILGVLREAGCRKVVKSKSMVTEEIHLNAALAEAGIEPLETDLGEYIQQLSGEPPYHIVTPAMHKSKAEISRLFTEKLGIAPTEDPGELTMAARRALRQAFLEADAGITGANFLVAETGHIAVTENEGNARLSFSLPRLHIAVAGMERVVPRIADLAHLWPLLATSGTGQRMTCYNSLLGGPATAGEGDGPREMHVVLLDNGRSAILADPERREALQCIRCGACLNACPIFNNIGGHAYGTTYQGPIGSVITPLLRPMAEWSHLSYASSLCGRCAEVCPVRIELHHHLLRNRRDATRARHSGKGLERLIFRLWAWFVADARRYERSARLARLAMRFPWQPPVPGWSRSREVPRLAERSFREWWRKHGTRTRQS